jgi:Family of unknown function (DUF6455)
MTFDYATVVALLIAAALAGALAAVLPSWRRLMTRGADLPFWKFTRRSGVGREALENDLGAKAVREAELRCSVCAAQEECEHRLAGKDAAPVSYCPNAALFTNDKRSAGRNPAA